jgi:hypothetical protein
MPEPVILEKVIALPDVLTTDHFNMLFPQIPGGGDSGQFLIQQMTGVLPGMKNEAMKVVLHRHAVLYAGKREYGHSFEAEFVDTFEKPILSGLKGWQELIDSVPDNLPKLKASYISDCLVEVYGAENSVVESRRFRNVWPSSIKDITLGTEGATAPVKVSVTFAYDYWEYVA